MYFIFPSIFLMKKVENMENYYKYIYAAYKLGSFTKAAEKLYVTQPTLSMAIKKVEDHLHMPLFYREGKSVTLTPVGKLYIKSIEKMMSIETDLQAEIRDIERLETGTVRIGGTQYINSCILPPVIAQFIQRYPKIDIQLKEQEPSKNLTDLAKGKIDFCCNAGTIDIPDLKKVPLFQDQIYLAVPDAYNQPDWLPWELDLEGPPWSEPKSIPLSDALFQLPIILLAAPSNLQACVRNAYADAHRQPHIVLQAEQQETSLQLACAGIGAAFVGEQMLRHRKPKAMHIYKIDHPSLRRTFYLLTNKKRYLTKAASAFVALWKKTAGETLRL